MKRFFVLRNVQLRRERNQLKKVCSGLLRLLEREQENTRAMAAKLRQHEQKVDALIKESDQLRADGDKLLAWANRDRDDMLAAWEAERQQMKDEMAQMRTERAPFCLRNGCLLMAKCHDVEEYYKDDDE